MYIDGKHAHKLSILLTHGLNKPLFEMYVQQLASFILFRRVQSLLRNQEIRILRGSVNLKSV